MRPLYFEPAVGRNSTVAFKLFTLAARALNFSMSSSRVASFATAIGVLGMLCFLLTFAQPPASAASVANPRHVHTRLINYSDTSRLYAMQSCDQPRVMPWPPPLV